MRWRFDPGFDAATRAAFDARKPLVYVCPPAVWMVEPLFERLERAGGGERRTVAVVPEGDLAQELALHSNAARHVRREGQHGPGVIAASGLARDTVALRRDDAATLIATPPDALALLQRSAFKAEQVAHTVLLWPERFADAEREATALLFSDTNAAQRIVVTEDPTGVTDLIERYARRAPTMHPIPWPATPLDGVRFAISTATRLPTAVVGALGSLAPRTALLWDPYPMPRARWIQFDTDPTVRLVTDQAPPTAADAIIATDLPSPDLLRAFQEHTSRVVLLIRPCQEAALARLASPNRLLSVTRETDRAHHRASALRSELRQVLASTDLSGELLQLAPLFDEHDPATVAAALLRSSGGSAIAVHPSWVRIKLDVGKRDRIKPGDVVGALINAAGIPKDHVGRVELHEVWSIVEVRVESADVALRGLKVVALRGRTVTPRVEAK